MSLRSWALGLTGAILAAIPAVASAAPLHLVSRQALDSRLQQLTFTTPAVSGPTKVRVLLPAGDAAHPRRRYPVLYLLHGAVDTNNPLDIAVSRGPAFGPRDTQEVHWRAHNPPISRPTCATSSSPSAPATA